MRPRRRLVRIVLLTCTAAALLAERPASAEPSADVEALLKQARAAYTNRHVQGNSRKAYDCFEKAIALDPSFDALWEGARAAWFLGDFTLKTAPRRQRAAVFERGMDWSRKAVALRPDRAEGHLWLGILLGLHAQTKSVFHQMSVAREIRLSAENAVKLDPTVECGAAQNLLGSYFLELPEALGGDDDRAVKLLRKAVRDCPIDPYHHVVLAQALRAVDLDDEARTELEWILSASPPEPGWGPEYQWAQKRARELLAE